MCTSQKLQDEINQGLQHLQSDIIYKCSFGAAIWQTAAKSGNLLLIVILILHYFFQRPFDCFFRCIRRNTSCCILQQPNSLMQNIISLVIFTFWSCLQFSTWTGKSTNISLRVSNFNFVFLSLFCTLWLDVDDFFQFFFLLCRLFLLPVGASGGVS